MIGIQIFFLIIFISERIERISSIVEPFKWMHYKPYGSTVYLEPLFNDTICEQSSDCYWLLPNRTRLNYPLNVERFTISANGTLTIVDIQPIDNGIYHFFRRNSSDWIVSKALLNIHGAPFDSLWLEYWPNVVGGLVAMAAVLISFGVIMVVDKYRYRPPTKPVEQEQRENTAFELGETEIVPYERPNNSRRTSKNSGTDICVERF